jgi:PleD family two-component response regulator
MTDPKANNQSLPRVLIVDDEAFNIKVLTDFLKEDCKIMAAKDGEAALKAAFGPNPPDLILLDILMPGIDGYEVCKRLKADDATKDIPIIFVTAISEAMDAARAFELGAVDYVAKPFNPVTVKARVRTHIQLSQALINLQEALEKVKKLSGLLPICSYCKKIRDDKGYWNYLEAYISEHSEAEFSHSICEECKSKHFPPKKQTQD